MRRYPIVLTLYFYRPCLNLCAGLDRIPGRSEQRSARHLSSRWLYSDTGIRFSGSRHLYWYDHGDEQVRHKHSTTNKHRDQRDTHDHPRRGSSSLRRQQPESSLYLHRPCADVWHHVDRQPIRTRGHSPGHSHNEPDDQHTNNNRPCGRRLLRLYHGDQRLWLQQPDAGMCYGERSTDGYARRDSHGMRWNHLILTLYLNGPCNHLWHYVDREPGGSSGRSGRDSIAIKPYSGDGERELHAGYV